MKRLWWAWCIGVVLAISGCGDDCPTTAPVIERCEDDDDCDKGGARDSFPDYGWTSQPPK